MGWSSPRLVWRCLLWPPKLSIPQPPRLHPTGDVAPHSWPLLEVCSLVTIHPSTVSGVQIWDLTFLSLNAAFLIRAGWYCIRFYGSPLTLSHWACGQPNPLRLSHVIFSNLYLWVGVFFFFFGPKCMTWHLSLLNFHLVKVSRSLYPLR